MAAVGWPQTTPTSTSQAFGPSVARPRAATGWRRIPLLSVRVSGLGSLARQLDLFSATPLRDAKLSAALHKLEERFGSKVIRRAATLGERDADKGR